MYNKYKLCCILGVTVCCCYAGEQYSCGNWQLISSLLGTHWSAAMTTSHSSSRWCPAWSSFALIWSWLADISYNIDRNESPWYERHVCNISVASSYSGCSLSGRGPLHARILQTSEPPGLWGKATQLRQLVPSLLHLPHLHQPGVGWQRHSPLKWR